MLSFLYLMFAWTDDGHFYITIPEIMPWAGDRNISFTISGLIATVILILITISSLAGLNILGSGLQDSAVTLLITISAKIIAYLIASILTYQILSVLDTLGLIFYYFLLISFIMGVLDDTYMQGKGDNE